MISSTPNMTFPTISWACWSSWRNQAAGTKMSSMGSSLTTLTILFAVLADLLPSLADNELLPFLQKKGSVIQGLETTFRLTTRSDGWRGQGQREQAFPCG